MAPGSEAVRDDFMSKLSNRSLLVQLSMRKASSFLFHITVAVTLKSSLLICTQPKVNMSLKLADSPHTQTHAHIAEPLERRARLKGTHVALSSETAVHQC